MGLSAEEQENPTIKQEKKYSKHPNEYNKTILKNASKNYKNIMNKHINKYNKENESKLRQMQKNRPKEYWKMLNKLKTKTKAKAPKLDQLYKHFKNINNTESQDENINLNEILNEADQNCLNCPFTQAEIEKSIKSLKNNKASGIDEVINEHIKYSSTKMVPIYANIFNIILNTGKIPQNWSKGIILPIYKNKGDSTEPINYRPITLLSCIGKLFTCTLNNRLNTFLLENNILKENQAGFRKNYSTTDHIFTLNSLIEILRHHKKKLFCAYIDFSKAFDSVWRLGMWQKLINNNIKGIFFRVIHNMYQNIKSCVQAIHTDSEPTQSELNTETPTHQKYSDFFECNIGVRQGENLSPILFSLYLNDLEAFLTEKQNTGIDLSTLTDELTPLLKLMLLLYADDTIIISDNAAALQKCLDDFMQYCNNWKLNVNIDKTKIVIFGAKKPEKHSFKLNNINLEIVDSYKYLGVYFSKSGTFTKAKKHLSEQADKALHFLYTAINNIQLPLDLILKLFDQTIIPILTYASEIWGYENTDIIQRIENKFLRSILKLRKSTPIYMLMGELGRYPIDIIIKSKMITFWNRLLTGSHDKIAYQIYQIMLKIPNFKSKWISKIKHILQETGRQYLWDIQDNIPQNICQKIKQNLIDQHYQIWHSSLEKSSKGRNYSLIKENYKLEDYLLKLKKMDYLNMIKYRTANHYLPIETGRWDDTDISERTCKLCNTGEIGDEYHYLLICTFFNQSRNKYIPHYYSRQPSFLKYKQIMTNKNINSLQNTTAFIKIILNTFNPRTE